MAADANQEVTAKGVLLSRGAHRFESISLPRELPRKLLLLEISTLLPSPANPVLQKELAAIETSLEGDYGKGTWCPDGPQGKCLDVTALGQLMATSRDPQELKRAWAGWQAVGAPMRDRCARMVDRQLRRRELGFKDAGQIWKLQYDMSADESETEVDRLWQQLQPFYSSLHAYVRAQLVKKYGKGIVPPNGPIPAHLLGNIWSQEWNNISDLMDAPKSPQSYNLTKILQDRKTDARGMVKYGENFFTSLGFAPLPQTFWERSLFTKPADRDVVCHASAWDLDAKDDVRIKVCLHMDEEDFRTVHHELGHNFYQRAYKDQPPLFLFIANDGFHEAVGDTIALSITPEYLKQIGLIDSVPPPSGDTKYLLDTALEKVSFLPFGLLVDKWRWDVFSGKIKPENYNKAWWDLRTKYQGIAPPVARSEADFDPGASSFPAILLIRVIFSRASYNSSFTEPCAAKQVSPDRFIVALFMATKPPAQNSTKCSAWAAASPGLTNSKSSQANENSMPARSSNILPRSKPGSMNKTAKATTRSAGSKLGIKLSLLSYIRFF
jgi:peptidyl-dipeptidase A